MRHFILFFSMVLTLSSCSQNEEEENTENSIVGKWQLIEVYGSDGGSNPQWKPVKEGYFYTFNSDGSIISNRFSCNGIFNNKNTNSLTIEFNCINSQFNATYKVAFDKNTIILIPNPNPCDEGCSEKYKRL